MPTISFGGINTGLPPNLVDQLVEAEKVPIRIMEQRKGNEEARLKLINELETGVGKIRDSIGGMTNNRGFVDMKLVSGDPSILQGAVDPTVALPGSWNIEVVELAQKPSAITNGFPDKDRTQIGVGYFSFKTPQGTKEVYINGTNGTLDGVANAINRARVGVRASVIRDSASPDSPYRLVLSGQEYGSEKQIEFPTLYFLDGDQDLYFEEKRDAKNGKIRVDGFDLEIGDNQITDYIPGVTVDLKQAAPGRSINLTVEEDVEVVAGKVKSFVDAMNEVLKFIQKQSRIDAKTDTSANLGGDSLVRSVEGRLRQLIQSPVYGVEGSIKYLNQLGIEYSREGILTFDQEKFNSVLAKNSEDVQSFFAGNGLTVGFIPQLRSTISTLLDQSFGPITNRKRGIQQKIDSMDQRIARQEDQIAKKEVSLRRKFSQLEETMSRLKQQGGAVQAMAGAAFNGIQLKQG